MIVDIHPTLMLIFGRPNDLESSIVDLRTKIVGSHAIKTSIEIVTAFEWDYTTGIATFLLPRSKADHFVKGAYEVALLDHMFWRIRSSRTCLLLFDTRCR
jgi:hypothetical protein